MDRLLLKPVTNVDSFGTGYRHRAFRLLVDQRGSIRKACWVVLERDGSVSVGLSDPGIVITEIGTAHVDATGRVSSVPDPPLEEIPAPRRTGPHATLHRDGVCHVRANRERPLINVNYGAWFPPSGAFEWLHVFTAPVAAMPEIPLSKIKNRDTVLTVPRTDLSLAIRADVLPRSDRDEYLLLGGALHTAVGIAPEYALRLTVFAHSPVQPRLLVRVQQKSKA